MPLWVPPRLGRAVVKPEKRMSLSARQAESKREREVRLRACATVCESVRACVRACVRVRARACVCVNVLVLVLGAEGYDTYHSS